MHSTLLKFDCDGYHCTIVVNYIEVWCGVVWCGVVHCRIVSYRIKFHLFYFILFYEVTGTVKTNK